MKIAVASGKGGVGKSMFASSLAILFSKERKVIAIDCDVDMPNLAIWLGLKKFEKEQKVKTSFSAIVNEDQCISCGMCKSVCNYNAIEVNEVCKINSLLCDGCGACKVICPVGAINLEEVENGLIRINEKGFKFPVIDGKLFPGEKGSGKIVSELRKKASDLYSEVIILDSAAGVGCAVIASIVGVDFLVLVTEPTQTGLSDLKRIIDLAKQLDIPFGIVINKWDINSDFAKRIKTFANKNYLGKVSYNRRIIDSLIKFIPIMDTELKAVEEIKTIFEKIKKKV